jgi:hypothetical protein
MDEGFRLVELHEIKCGGVETEPDIAAHCCEMKGGG